MDGIVYWADIDTDFARTIFCYPIDADSPQCMVRASLIIKLLSRAGVRRICSYGQRVVHGYRVLGKGWSSIVVLAETNKGQAVVKIRRVDSRRASLEREAMVLEYLRYYSVAPAPYFWCRDIIVMEYIEGLALDKYLQRMINRGDTLSFFIRRLLSRAWLLDILGVDHTELNRPSTHVIIDNTGIPFFIDFESARFGRKVHNLSSIVSYLVFRSGIRDVFNCINKKRLLTLLQLYKKTLRQQHLLEISRELTQCLL